MSVYLPGEMLADLRAEARRQQRTVSWLLRNAWRLARKGMDALPGAPDLGGDEKGWRSAERLAAPRVGEGSGA